MRVIADLHLHSMFSRATSKQMDLDHLASFSKLKGLSLIGTGDFTHPEWFAQLKEKLKPIDGSGLYEYKNTKFMLTVEVSTVYDQDKKIRKIHHLILCPSLEIANQVNETLRRFGRLDVDGRPVFNGLTSPHLVEVLNEIDDKIEIIPAHAWTPWYGVFGSKSGFDSLKECYQDQVKHIHALETGLSSDPPMNWRISKLDKITLVSNSDAHSPWPWRLGREANVFELKELSYFQILKAIREKDNKKFLFTIEVDPAYGKYHFDGHRECGISLDPKEAIKLNNVCPKCGKKLTIGVLHRVEELADRPEGFIPKDAIPFKTLLPLYEIISFVTGTNQLYSKRVLKEHDKLIAKFGNELNVLLNVPKEELSKVTNEKIADAIIKVREGKVNFIPGYDGKYGIPIFNEEEFKKYEEERKKLKIYPQKRLIDFKGL